MFSFERHLEPLQQLKEMMSPSFSEEVNPQGLRSRPRREMHCLPPICSCM